jgi:alpha-beta hydrolase superfamily lysophospholipase
MQPRLIDVRVPKRPEGVVLVLHGGASRREHTMVSPAQLSVLRMIPIARRIARAGRGRLAVHRLLNSHRGWATHHTPVDDTRWALDQLGAELPVCLVGHSLGGRAAILSVTQPEVRSAVALAPWVYPDDVPSGLRGDEQILVVHGDSDRIPGPRAGAGAPDRRPLRGRRGRQARNARPSRRVQPARRRLRRGDAARRYLTA